MDTGAKSHVWVLPMSTSQYELFCAFSRFGRISGKTHQAIIFGKLVGNTWYVPPPKSDVLYLNDCTTEQVTDVVRGALQIQAGDAAYDDRMAEIGLRPSEFFADMEAAYVKDGKSPDSFFSYLYFQFDALTAAAFALDRAERDLREHHNTSLAYFHYNDTRVVKNLVEQLSNMSFEGLTGPVAFSATGNRVNGGWVLGQFQGKFQNFYSFMNEFDCNC